MGHRRFPTLLVLSFVTGVAWVGFAHWVVPPVIVSAFEGRSLSPLNRFFQGRIAHPVEHYLALWQTFAVAVLIAGCLHLLIVLWLRSSEELSHAGAEGRRTDRILVVFSLFFLAVTVLSGPRHDYVAYLEIWDAVRKGRDPWWIHPVWGYPINAYGPIFNALAGLAGLNPLLPKLLFSLAYLTLVVWLVKRVDLGRGSVRLFPAGLLVLVVNPFAWVEIAYFGHFDVLIGIACVAAVHERLRERETLAGVCLALGILLKYLPIVILPFLIVEGRRIRFRLFLGTVLTTGLGLGLSLLVWGSSTFRPLSFAATRGSSLLSIFRFLRGTASPLRLIVDTPNVDFLSLPCLALAGLSVFAWCVGTRVAPATASVLSVLTTVIFYRVGFPQYQMVLYLLICHAIIRGEIRVEGNRPLWIAFVCYFGGLGLFDTFYAAIGGVIHPDDRWAWVDEVVGLPSFVLGAFLLWTLVRSRNGQVSPAIYCHDVAPLDPKRSIR